MSNFAPTLPVHELEARFIAEQQKFPREQQAFEVLRLDVGIVIDANPDHRTFTIHCGEWHALKLTQKYQRDGLIAVPTGWGLIITL